MQVIEGPSVSIAVTFSRILADQRHHHISILSDDRITERQFSDWTMAHRRAGEHVDAYDSKMRRALGRTIDRVRTHFLKLMANDDLHVGLPEGASAGAGSQYRHIDPL